MQNDVILDISENAISHLNVSLLEILLFDRTTRKNFLWATDDYAERGVFYAAGDDEYSAPERAPRPAELSSEAGGVEQRFRCR